MTMRRSAILLLLGALALGATTTTTLPAFAQNNAALQEAQQRFEEGLKFADEGNHEQARLKFSQAYAVFKSASVLYNLARSEQLTGHDLEALEHFREFVKLPQSAKVPDAQRQKAKDNIETLEKRVPQIDVDVPPGAHVKVDDRAFSEIPKESVPVTPGKHTVEATYEGKIKSVTVDCSIGHRTKATIVFEVGTTEPPPPGGGEKSSARYVVPGVIGVVGLIGLGFGIGFAGASQSSKDQEDRLRENGAGICGANGNQARCDELKNVRDDVNSQATFATVSYIAGGAFIVGAVVTYLLWPSSRSSTGSRFHFSPVANGGTVHFGTSF